MSEVPTGSRGSARHRAPVRPLTPFSSLSFSKVRARRGVLTMASSSLALTMAASSAAAAPETTTTQAQPQADVTVTGEARTALVTTPEVSTSADASWSVDAAEAEATPPPPPPEPEPEPVVERESAVSRDTYREDTTSSASSAAPSTSETVSSAPASGIGAQIVAIARQYIGTPYVYGGNTPAGFDCSGFTQYVYSQVGISLPSTTDGQYAAGYVVSAAEAQPGDLVWEPGHIGIYTGNGQHIAARNPSTPLYESPIYMSNPVFIRVA
ncbi:C40 family peptidase [Georgenia alba]|uniref:C40 family peptidase n=1 Tax=Georgenia alba TaxID=2233858 RepID=A0ABW2Q5Z2_9MICO